MSSSSEVSGQKGELPDGAPAVPDIASGATASAQVKTRFPTARQVAKIVLAYLVFGGVLLAISIATFVLTKPDPVGTAVLTGVIISWLISVLVASYSLARAGKGGKIRRAVKFIAGLLAFPTLALSCLGFAAGVAVVIDKSYNFSGTHGKQVAALAPFSESLPRLSMRPAAASQARVALVIGNSSYGMVAHLPNAKRDAEQVAKSFRRLGFKTVRLATDLSHKAMREALIEFGREATEADWAVIYFGGHGIEVDGRNFLIPTDARLLTDRDVDLEAISLEHVLRSVEGARKLRVIILDACRENPFLSRMEKTVASRSIGRGLASVEPEGSTLVAYSAKGGQVALDGDGANSPYVSALIRNLEKPGVEADRLFRLIRDEVMASTGARQEPFVYGTLPAEQFFFNPP